MQIRRESRWTQMLLVMVTAASTSLVVRTLWRAFHAEVDPALEQNVTIVASVGAGMLAGALSRHDSRLRWPARLLYTALGSLIAIGVLGTLTKEWG